MTYDLNEAQEEQPSLSLEEMEKMWGAETDLLQSKVSGVYVKVRITQDGVFVVQPSQILRDTSRRFLSSR